MLYKTVRYFVEFLEKLRNDFLPIYLTKEQFDLPYLRKRNKYTEVEE